MASINNTTTKQKNKKYIEVEGATQYIFDEERIKRDEMFDGYYAIQTSEEAFTAEQILEAYQNLWKIEESFRVMKHILEVRVVYH